MEKMYTVEGLLPMTKDQIINYFKSGNHLTKDSEGYHLTGGTPKEVKKNNKTVVKYYERRFGGYEDYFNKMLCEGYITKAFAGFNELGGLTAAQ